MAIVDHEGKITFEGAVLELATRRAFDPYDDNYIALVWDEENQCVKDVCYGGTHPGSRNGKATVDASEQVRQKAEQYRAKRQKEYKIKKLVRERERLISDRQALQLKSYSQLKKLKKAVSDVQYDVAFTLLKTKSFRSKFRESLAKQIRNWIETKDNEYDSPLSSKQWSCLLNVDRWK